MPCTVTDIDSTVFPQLECHSKIVHSGLSSGDTHQFQTTKQWAHGWHCHSGRHSHTGRNIWLYDTDGARRSTPSR